MYPDDSVQYYAEAWWEPDGSKDLCRGRLVRAFVPYFGLELRRLVVVGREDARSHNQFHLKVEPFAIGAPTPSAKLPVAAMPRASGEDFLAIKGKYRPALIVSAGGPLIADDLRRGRPKRQTAPTLLLAPYFGADLDGTRAGFHPEFVKRVRRAEFPHFCWDQLPIGGPEVSLLRLDYLFPVPKEATAVEPYGYRLSPRAIPILDDWLSWLFTGKLDAESDLGIIREGLPEA